MIFILSQEEENHVTFLRPQKSANILGLTRPRAYVILTKLEQKGILERRKKLGFFLTKMGNQVIDVLNHRKQILEIFLHHDLDFDLESASEESLKLLLAISDKIIDRLCKKMGKPKECPHNLIIPHELEPSLNVNHQLNR